MEFIISQPVLKKELSVLSGIVERKSTIPGLSNILIESIGENTIQVTGTDLDVTLRCEVEAKIKKTGAICIQARKLFDIVRLLPNDDMCFEKQDNEWVSLTCRNSNFCFAGLSKEQFPEVPEFRSASMKLPAEIFVNFIHNTSFAITNEQSRFTLSGAKFMIEGKTARMVTTDAHRLAFIEREIENPEGVSMDTLIPKKSLHRLAAISNDVNGDIKFGEDTNHIYFEANSSLLWARKLSGNFPNYEMVIPKDNDKRAVFDPVELKCAVDRVALMSDERTRSVRVTIRDGEFEISAQSSEEGEGKELVPVEYNGEEVCIGFNSQYLQEFLNTVTSTEIGSKESEKEADGERVKVKEKVTRSRISFEFKDSNKQTQLSYANDSEYDYKYIVMPLRI